MLSCNQLTGTINCNSFFTTPLTLTQTCYSSIKITEQGQGYRLD